MRKIIVLQFMTLDGVVQAPGGPDEDTSSGFEYGGWVWPYSDEVSGKEIEGQMVGRSYDLLLGRKTYDIFANYWPQHGYCSASLAALPSGDASSARMTSISVSTCNRFSSGSTWPNAL